MVNGEWLAGLPTGHSHFKEAGHYLSNGVRPSPDFEIETSFLSLHPPLCSIRTKILSLKRHD
jgi:hypothetical protein